MKYTCENCFSPLSAQKGFNPNDDWTCSMCGHLNSKQNMVCDDMDEESNEVIEKVAKDVASEYKPDEVQVEVSIYEKFYDAYLKLPETGKMVIDLRYGMIDGEHRTYEEIAKILNISVEEVKSIERKTLRILRKF